MPGHDFGLCKESSAKLIQKVLEAINEKHIKKEEEKRNKVECASRSFEVSSSDFEVQGSGRGFTASPASANVINSGRSSFFDHEQSM